MNTDLEQSARLAKLSTSFLRTLSADKKKLVLRNIAQDLRRRSKEIEEVNALDLARAEAEGLSNPLLKRLKFSGAKIEESAVGLEALANMAEPVGVVQEARKLDEGLELFRVTVPLGVVAMIFESRPDALVQMAGLCLKSSNAVILKGGREAMETNRFLAGLIQECGRKEGLNSDWLYLAETREDVKTMLTLEKSIDLIIPRGSNDFVKYIMDNTRIPVLGHADGIVHLYLHEDADTTMSVRIAVDSKTQYVAVCNAVETLLIHEAAAQRLLPAVANALRSQNVRLLGCEKSCAILPDLEKATEQDWDTEYLDYTLSIKIVGGLEEAIQHINTHGSGHTETIVTENKETALAFMDRVDSADVFWNTSTRFSDGYKFGLGAEVGIATGKLHARGPMGVQGLLTSQWRLFGHGQTAADYSGGGKTFIHTNLPFDSYSEYKKD